MTEPKSLFEKIWDAHTVLTRADGASLLFVDRHIVHDGTRQAFDMIEAEGLSVRRPDLTLSLADHYVATGASNARRTPTYDDMVNALGENAARWGIRHHGAGDPQQGIVHVAAPQLGFTLPGVLLVCGDSHTATHGALGCLAFGVGASEIAHVLATQTIWQNKPRSMRVTIDGTLGRGVSAKDVILALIGTIGAGGGTGHVIEYAGSAVRELSVEGRLTVCNMSIEAGARAGMVAPDEKTFAYLKGRPLAPAGETFERAVAHWRTLASDAGARFDREVRLDADTIAPMVTWGTSPQDAAPITARVPNPSDFEDPARRKSVEAALAYMGLTPDTPLADIAVDRVFIGSCTNGRLEDLRSAADVARGRKARVPALVVPGSGEVKRLAEAEGLDRIFIEAGFEWGDPGCSMCVAMNGDLVPEGERCASSSNRNFAGRQGKGSRTHLVSPAMAAAAAVTGHLTDSREL
ncbi:3-isopropylmalate dehydratase large subunit [Acuticoccus sediminis]|uniref:3-isopropylmalate dehydratase large subunit n=1 Tax=Acuticoccus sediminis TaxID=2184697 RepID=A0A8B2NK78_9HYPH|nr:3-isopropylmalate dehydratase large subunit [Acuticoccus sediminis]RAH97761.1 3-isopropylmalate dehydratase large subunit [Acuticoccus sediminis]